MQFSRSRTIAATLNWIVAIGLLIAMTSTPASAQFDDFQVLPELGKFNSGPPDPQLQFESRIRMQPGAKVGILEISASMDPTWHVYSLTQPPGGPLKSVIKLESSDQYRLLGSFAPNHPPHVHFVDAFKMDVEEFSGNVTWSAPIEILGSESSLKIAGFVEGQVCADGGACVPFDEREAKFEATVDGTLTAAETAALTGSRLKNTHAPIRAWLSTSEAKPGDTVNLFVSFNPDEKWHVYAYEKKQASMFQHPTLIQAALPAGWELGNATSAAPIISEEGLPNDPPVRYYEGAVTITQPIKIPENANVGSYPLKGNVAYQTCAKTCDRPTAIAWNAQLSVVEKPSTTATLGGVSFDATPSSYDAVAKLVVEGNATTVTNPNVQTAPAPGGGGLINAPTDGVASRGIDGIQFEEQSTAPSSIWKILGLAFVGGFVLNFMPCVLPVIGLKILSFVDQAGSDRVKIFNLNLWYAFGMLAVFWVLAILAAGPALGLSENGLGWGEQFNYQGFAIPLICVVFVMALSFLDVWEIPIPGFATTSKASELTEKGGYSGAFFKGAITTVLATPCSAPALSAAYAFAVNSGSVTMPFLIFTVMGLGMAIPYLLIGAFPSLIRFLPKPGAWMDTFKQLMGFVLLATVIFLMQNVTMQNLLPTIALLFGLWFACWWIGRVPLTAESDKRMRAWGVAVVISLLAVAISFGRHVDAFGMTFSGLLGKAEQKYNWSIDRAIGDRQLVATGSDVGDTSTTQVAHGANSLPWEPFRPELLDELIEKNNTIMIDFTADW